MTYIDIRSENLIERLFRQAETWKNFLGKPIYIAPKASIKYSLRVAEQATEIDSSTLNREAELEQSISFAEIFHLTLPLSPKVIEFNRLIEDIWADPQDITLLNRDDSNIIRALSLISDILDTYWNEFPIKVKVILLQKLKGFNKTGWFFIINLVPKFTKALETHSERNKKYAIEYTSLDKPSQNIILNRAISNFIPSLKALFSIWKVTRKIFKRDGQLFRENQESIHSFTIDVKNLIQKKIVNKPYVIKMTQEDITEKVASFDRFREYKRQLWSNATSEEQAESDRQFEHLSKLLKDARDIRS